MIKIQQTRNRFSMTVSLIVAALAVSAGPAQAACTITDLPCWGPGKKCNIKFRNKTGESSGSDTGAYNQETRAKTLKIRSEDANGARVGSNTLSILAGASNTMNLDKKDGFDHINIKAIAGGDKGDMVVDMSCKDIRATLQGSGTCKVYMHKVTPIGSNTAKYYTSYNCDGGKVTGSSVDY